MTDDQQIEILWDAILGFAERCKATPLNQHAGCWTQRIDDNWWIAANGHTEPRDVICQSGHQTKVRPFEVYLEWCGWPAGFITAGHIEIAAGSAANIQTFITALNASKREPCPTS